MQVAFVTLVIFLAILSLGIAVILALRGNRDAEAPEPALRRIRTPVSDGRGRSVTESLDDGFNRLVWESAIGLPPMMVVLVMLLTGILAGGLVLLVRDNPLQGSLAALLGLFLPVVFMTVRRAIRFRQMEDRLPDAIDMMARAVHAGETLEQAVSLAANETPGPLGGEFLWCSRQLDLGLPVSATMKGLSTRVRLLSIRTLASTLAVHRTTGGNLAATLERLAEVSRSRLDLQRQVRAATGAGRLSGRLMAAAGPVLFLAMMFIQPDHLQTLFNSPTGRILLAVAIMLEIVGIVWLTRLTRSDA